MKGSRWFRVVFGIIVLILFSFYTYKRISTSPHSNDFDSEHAFRRAQSIFGFDYAMTFRVRESVEARFA